MSDPWPHRDEQCPDRGPLLSHIQKKGSFVCTYCGQMVSSGTPTQQIPPPPPEPEEPPPPLLLERGLFTPKQLKYFEFLHWAWLQDLA